MTFTTLTFLLFLIVVFTSYWALRRRRPQNVLLVVCSYAFYAWWDYRFCALMLISTLVDYTAARLLMASSGFTRRRFWLGVSIVVNLGMLGFFKYFNFFADSFQNLAGLVGWTIEPVTLHVILPVGISFYTFQTLGYTIDVYRRRSKACKNLLDYFTYVSFFPQLVAGPIERAHRLLEQFAAPRTFDRAVAADGCRQMLWGIAKKMLIADNLAPFVEAAYADPGSAGGPQLIFATVCFAFQIYCDFSGYTDIAIGTAKLFGIRLMRNFAYPYFSQSVAEFWRRWHISLSTWFRDYVYLPLGGSKVGVGRRAWNIMITFLVSGLWHGASWNFVIWGGVNGAAILPVSLRKHAPERLGPRDVPGGDGRLPQPAVFARMLGTFAIICATWVFFRARTFDDALTVFARGAGGLFSGAGWAELGDIIGRNSRSKIPVLLLLVFIAVEWIQRGVPHGLARLPKKRAVRWLIYTTVVWIVVFWGTRASSPFIYFQF